MIRSTKKRHPQNPRTTAASQQLSLIHILFEKMCQDYLFYYADDLPVELNEIGQWWGTDSNKKRQIQIDLVGVPAEGKDYIIGSCKYKNERSV